mgnify:CR=1 FL=1|jgi:TM2 domain-containing membrane protein YozV
MQCPQCGTDNRNGVSTCVVCGAELITQVKPSNIPNIPDIPLSQTTDPYSTYSQAPISTKNKSTAGILAILLGSFGAHKFYLSKSGLGVLYLLFCWTGIPGVVGIIEGIIYLTMSDRDFALKYH